MTLTGFRRHVGPSSRPASATRSRRVPRDAPSRWSTPDGQDHCAHHCGQGPVCNHVCNQKRLLWDVWHSISSSLLFASGPLHVSQFVRNHRVLWYRVVATPSCHMCMSDVVRARPREAARGRGRPRVRAGSLSNYRSIFVSLGVRCKGSVFSTNVPLGALCASVLCP